jgi:hypothetical protein
LSITIVESKNIAAAPVIHPGEHLAQELNELGMSADELSRKLNVISSELLRNSGSTSRASTKFGLPTKGPVN